MSYRPVVRSVKCSQLAMISQSLARFGGVLRRLASHSRVKHVRIMALYANLSSYARAELSQDNCRPRFRERPR